MVRSVRAADGPFAGGGGELRQLPLLRASLATCGLRNRITSSARVFWISVRAARVHHAKVETSVGRGFHHFGDRAALDASS
jgi:hypothetical protein